MARSRVVERAGDDGARLVRPVFGGGPSGGGMLSENAQGPSRPLFETEAFRAVAGEALRPGGTTLTRLALARLGLAAGSRVVDVGCGRGATLRLLAGLGFEAVGVDPSGELLAEVANSDGTGPTLPGAVRLVRGSAESLPLAAGCAAAVTCECVLSVTRDKALALAGMRRVLAPGGALILSDLYLRGPRGTSCGGPGMPGDDASRLPAGCASGAVSRDELESLLSGAGFRVRFFEDHTRLLAELAGRLIFAGMSASALGAGCSGAGRPGYYLCLASRP